MEATGVQEYIYNDRDKQPPAFLKKLILVDYQNDVCIIVKRVARKNDLVACEQQGRRPVCTSAKSDQRLCYSLSGKV